MNLLLRNVRPMGGASVDILIRDARISEIGAGLMAPGIATEDGCGHIVVPGLVEGHTHLDKTVMGLAWYVNDNPPEIRAMIDNERRVRRTLGIDSHTQSMRHALALIGAGTTHIRSHVDIDTEHGLSILEGVLRTRQILAGQVEIEIVAFPQSGLISRPGTIELLDEALAMGADLVGGIDPCLIDRDPKTHVDAVFDLAGKHGKGIDIHLHEPGDLGAFSLDLIMDRTRALGMKGQVAVSHAFCLGSPDWQKTERLLDAVQDLDIAILTTGAPSAEVPLVKRLMRRGIRMGAGSDGCLDTWNPWNRPDMLDRARIVAQRNNLRSDADLALVLELCSSAGATVLGLHNHHIAAGNAADLTLVQGRTLTEAVALGAPRFLTVKGGRITARNGTALMEAP